MKKLILILITVCGVSAQNLVSNPGFESQAVASGAYTHVTTTNGITSWWVGTDSAASPQMVNVDLVGENIPGLPSGNSTQFVDLCGLDFGRIMQPLTTVATTNYTVSFKYARNALASGVMDTTAYCYIYPTGNSGNFLASLKLMLPQQSTTITVDTNRSTSTTFANVWTTTNFTFTASGTTTTIAFETASGPDKPSGGILVDDVSVTAN